MTRHKLQLGIYLSALLLSLGVFLPLTRFPLYGDISYYRMAWIEASLVIAFALAAPAFILAGRGKWCLLCPMAVWLVLLFPALESTLRQRSAGRLSQLGNNLATAMEDFAARLLLNITEFQWGGFVFLFALFVFTFSSLVYFFKMNRNGWS